MITREQKTKEISAIAEKFSRAKAAFLVDFIGINVEDVTGFRMKLRQADSELRVVKNTLCKRAMADYPETEKALADELINNNAIIFSFGDVGATAKLLSDTAKEIEHLKIKAGVMEGEKLDKGKILYLAKLPSKDVLRAQLLGTLAAPMSMFVRVLSEVPAGFVRTLNAHKEKQGN